MSKLTFESLTPYEKLMLKVRAHKIYYDKPEDAPMCVVEATFEIINSLGYDIVRNNNSNPQPKKNEPTAEDEKEKSGYWTK